MVVTLPSHKNDRLYFGGASDAAISLSPEDIRSFFEGEPHLGDVDVWHDRHFRSASDSIERLRGIFSRLLDGNTTLSAEAAEFWKRAIIDSMTTALVTDGQSDSGCHLPSAFKIVRTVEDYLDRTPTVPVHISQICSKLKFSRRTLHRAFHDVLGLGPGTFLQRRRLCDIRTSQQ